MHPDIYRFALAFTRRGEVGPLRLGDRRPVKDAPLIPSDGFGRIGLGETLGEAPVELPGDDGKALTDSPCSGLVSSAAASSGILPIGALGYF
mmetsp:Transcript_19423/g.58650  ORF Transcript_19423/g.58650 Transcript_19423/m.58650 type:complete len:92 (+) Transcript_19423:450-725(+)